MFANPNTGNGSTFTLKYTLSQITSSEDFWDFFFQTPIASWKGNRVSDSYFPILEAEKLK